MTTLLNSFEGGSNGTTITTANSGAASGTAFDLASLGAGGTLAFSNAQAAHGTLSCNTATVAANVTQFGWSTTFGAPTQFWFRCYLYFASLPTATTRFVTCSNTGGTGLVRYAIQQTSGKILVQDATGGAITTSTAVIPTGAWFRIEGMAILSATVGQTQVELFTAKDGTIPAETDTSLATQNTLTGTQHNYLFGPATPVANQGPYFLDDVGMSTTGPLGPVVTTTAPRSTSIVPQLIAAGVLA